MKIYQHILRILLLALLSLPTVIHAQATTDLATRGILLSNQSLCGDSFTSIRVVIENAGTSSLLNPTATVILSGAATDTIPFTYSGTLTSGTKDTVLLSTTFNTSVGGTFNIVGFSTTTGDAVTSNDTSMLTVTFNAKPAKPVVKVTGGCVGTPTTLAGSSSTPGATIHYYSKVADSIIGRDTLNINLSQDTTFYAFSRSFTSFTVGPKDSSLGAGGYRQLGWDLIFDVAEDVILDSVAVHADGPGTFGVNLLNSSGTTIATRTVTVKGFKKEFITLNLPIPAGKTYQLDFDYTNTGAPLLWRNSAGAVYSYTSLGGITITNNTFGTGNYYYYFYDWHYRLPFCTSDTVTVDVDVKEAPAAGSLTTSSANIVISKGTSASPDTMIAGDTIKYSLSAGADYSNANYGKTWTIDTVLATTTGGVVMSDTSFTLPSSGTTASLTITPGLTLADSQLVILAILRDLTTDCKVEYIRYLHILERPAASYVNVAACAGEILSLSPTYSGGVTSVEYAFGNGQKDTRMFPSTIYTKAGTYTLTAKLSNSVGLSVIQTNVINIAPSPVISNIAPIKICEGGQAMIGFTTPHGALSYKIYLPNGTVVNDSQQLYTFTKSGKINFTYVAIGTLCSDSDFISVQVLSGPTAGFKMDDVICTGEDVTVSDNSTNTPISLGFSNGDTFTDFNNIVFNTAGTLTYRYIYSNSFTACPDTLTGTLKVEAIITPDIVVKDTVCSGENFSISLNNVADSYSISFDGKKITSKSGQFKAPVVTSATSYTITAFVGNPNSNCGRTATRQIVVGTQPAATLVGSQEACAGEEITFTATGVAAGEVSTITVAGKSYKGTSATFTVPRTPQVTALLQVRGPGGCTQTESVNIIVDVSTLAEFKVADACIGENLKLTDVPIKPHSYSWDFGNGDKRSAVKPVYAYTAPGTYTVTLVMVNGAGCADTHTQQVTISDVPQANFDINSACVGEAFGFQNTTPTGAVSYSLKVSGKDVDVTVAGTPELSSLGVVNPGRYIITLFAFNSQGCSSQVTKNIDVYPSPDSGFIATTASSNREVEVRTKANNAASYSWNWGDGSPESNGMISTHTYAEDGTYTITLTVTSTNGCTSITTREVRALEVIQASSKGLSMRVYPNPAQCDHINLQLDVTSGGKAAIALYTIEGKLLSNYGTRTINSGSNTLQLALPVAQQSGLYLLDVEVDGKHYQLRVVAE